MPLSSSSSSSLPPPQGNGDTISMPDEPPSCIDYKDLHLTVEEIQRRSHSGHGRIGGQDVGTSEDLPSSLFDYKNQHLTVQEILQRDVEQGGNHTLSPSFSAIPSNITYKDQGRNLAELPAARDGSTGITPDASGIVATSPRSTTTNNASHMVPWATARPIFDTTTTGQLPVLDTQGDMQAQHHGATGIPNHAINNPTSTHTSSLSQHPQVQDGAIQADYPSGTSTTKKSCYKSRWVILVMAVLVIVTVATVVGIYTATNKGDADNKDTTVNENNEDQTLGGATDKDKASDNSTGIPSPSPTAANPEAPSSADIQTLSPTTAAPTVLDWIPLGDMIVGQAAGDAFGSWVSLSKQGHIVAVGAPENDTNGDNAGQVRVFRYNSDDQTDVWTQLGDFTGLINGQAAGDGLGRSVDLADNGFTLVAGAPYNNVNGENAGSVRVVEYKTGFGQWSNVGQEIVEVDDMNVEHNSNLVDFHSFGWAVSISGDGTTVAVDEIFSGTPFIRVYRRLEGGNWVQRGSNVGPAAGTATAMSLNSDGSVVALSGSFSNNVGIFVYRFDENEANWVLVGNGIPSGSTGSVDLSSDGTTVVAGGVGTGQVSVYRYNVGLNDWEALGSPIVGEYDGDFYGWSVAISANGSVVATGGWAVGAGRVQVFRYSSVTSQWEQLGKTIEGLSDGDQFGHAVAISSDGSIVAGGGRGREERTGHVRVFRINI